mmetsp:Transcript_36295/g.104268  ORF Transcript_36295/g.104268 Transcript_36295/m.104268 type:complete len:748 (+) Transcript_36295:54-2297(+)
MASGTTKRTLKGITSMFDGSAATAAGGTPAGASTPGGANASGGMTPKTPLTQISKTLQSRPNFKKTRPAASLGVQSDQDKTSHMGEQSRVKFQFWRILVLTAVLSSTLSFAIDNFTFIYGMWRIQFTNATNITGLLGVTCANVIMVLVARLIVRTTMECEGSGFPEMKAMLFGHVLDNYLTLRVLFIKAIGLAMLVSAGLPVGKEGPNCHMAACIAKNLDPEFIKKRQQSAAGSSQITKLILAACAVGVGASFSAPIGGVIFSLELMLPQVYDHTSYWGCFASGIFGSLTYEVLRSWTAGSTGLLPLISTNVAAGEGAQSHYPLCRLLLDVTLGAICGFLGGHWITMHAKFAKAFKDWRLKGVKPAAPVPAGAEPLLGTAKKRNMCGKIWNFQWRDLFLCALVTALNTVWAGYLPLLNGKPQPLLISNLFDKNLMMETDTWVLPQLGVVGTLMACLAMKWFMTIMSLSLSMPTGVVAPTMIIGALIGRTYGFLIPDSIKDILLTNTAGEPGNEEEYGAFMARFAIIGAASFCAAVCRAFAMAITVFEVLALPGAVLPLCSATLTAIFVANQVELPFFDKNLAGRGLGGIPALTFTDHAEAPAFSIMKKIDVFKDCLMWKTRLFDMHEILKAQPDTKYFAVVRPIDDGDAVLMGSMSRAQVDKIISSLDPDGNKPETPVDLMDPELQRPADGSDPLIEGCPPHVSPSTLVREVYLIMKVAHGENIVYVTRDGCLLGSITFASLMNSKV